MSRERLKRQEMITIDCGLLREVAKSKGWGVDTLRAVLPSSCRVREIRAMLGGSSEVEEVDRF